MTRKEFAQKEGIAVNTLNRIHALLKAGKGVKEIQEVVGMSDYNAARSNYFRFNRIINYIIYENIEKQRLNVEIKSKIEKRYYQNESEMTIPTYHPSQLQGEELEILKALI